MSRPRLWLPVLSLDCLAVRYVGAYLYREVAGVFSDDEYPGGWICMLLGRSYGSLKFGVHRRPGEDTKVLGVGFSVLAHFFPC